MPTFTEFSKIGALHRRRLRDLSIVQNTPNSKETKNEQQTAIGSLNVPKTPNEPAEIQTENCGMRRGRGHTPIGSEARLLAEYLGIIARNANMLPINYESWHQMPDSNKNQALDNITERFTLEVSDTYIKKALGKKWRDHKSTLKKEYFNKDINLEEKL
ncbi:RAS protein activator like-3 [Gossypium arboreum]|uniref:RAS protein activator like-3 n=1 Tax=Gossypium arboreum TaxID=29729 RepID=A0A0B0P1Q9_GOSAR|nr:RAS protein activator like-3 [Gossypium arboreum]